ncbi:Mov34-domain-containing protein [Tilletiaria anomala UBC 951]|uniref:COP9 signalosome complex subunit 6 n=1 Tax=Tilletiaria anomala (strain ATCC 24038 / CBS 436.72 / UBC 951) TaxID=1037660 RepID=A0A066VTR0_TILAU|nr:Mov34-domain-containing protein [Tilletiaria anomala UBC 951]KDN43673.1 Mov34-domain-containing protein [Tilletiaria anomala UBC 951]
MQTLIGESSHATALTKISDVVLDVTREAGVGVNLTLHPLPILNVSEHVTRARAQMGTDNVSVYGVLLGTQSGRNVEIHNAFEMRVDPAAPGAPAGGLQVNHNFLKSRQSQFKQVFPTLDFLGWYSVGPVPTLQDVQIHQQLLGYNEAPIFLQLSPTNTRVAEAAASGELPLSTYESTVEIVHGETKMFFVPTGYRIDTGEAERVAVDFASRPAESGNDAAASSSLLGNLKSSYNAIRMLADRIKALNGYVQSVHNAAPSDGSTLAEIDTANATTIDHETLRQIAALCASIAPSSEGQSLNAELLTEYHDVFLTNQLTCLTSGLNSLNELVDKFDFVSQPGKREAGLPPRSFRLR